MCPVVVVLAAKVDPLTAFKQIDRFLKGSFTDRQGNFNYKEWVKVLRVNEEDNDNEAQV
jgi:hypothetical protein